MVKGMHASLKNRGWESQAIDLHLWYISSCPLWEEAVQSLAVVSHFTRHLYATHAVTYGILVNGDG